MVHVLASGDGGIIVVEDDGTVTRMTMDEAKARVEAEERERRTVSVHVASGGVWGRNEDAMPDGLSDLIDWLTAHRGRIPAEHRANATFEVESDYESSSVEWTISYDRPETDEEVAKRLAEEAAWHAEQARERERRELATLAALKAKYET